MQAVHRVLRRGFVLAVLGLLLVGTRRVPHDLGQASATSQTFNVTGAVQSFTVPAGVTTVTIQAIGAAGGSGETLGGRGASIIGDFSSTPGQVLSVLVGRGGGNSHFGAGGGGGGGGGSFVWTGTGAASAANLLVAAGGGGGGGTAETISGCDAGGDATVPSAGTAPTTSDGGQGGGFADLLGQGIPYLGGVGGTGGGGGSASPTGDGAGGLLGDGGSVTYSGAGVGGSAIVNGGAGGSGSSITIQGANFRSGDGGYGGGGGGGTVGISNSLYSGGGGGGYNGGGNGAYAGEACGGGGGGSYNGGSNQVNTAGFGTAQGQVVISWVAELTDPTSDNVTDWSATLGGTVTADGGTFITEEGVVLAPTATNTNPRVDGVGVVKVTASSVSAAGAPFTVAVTGLASNTSYSFAAYANTSKGNSYSSVATFTTLAAVTSPTVTNIGVTAATLGATVNSAGAVTERGVVYAPTAANADPQIDGTGVIKATAATAGNGTFSVDVTGLTPGTAYSFAAYMTNSGGIAYSSVGSFTTLLTVASPTADSITDWSASLGGTVNSAAPITERGVVYAPTAANADPQIGGPGVAKLAAASAGSGTFSVAVTGLASNTSYSFAAYATNGRRTAYSSVATFTTLVAVTSPTATDIADTTATLGGSINSAATVTERGVVYAPTATNSHPQINGSGVTKVAAAAAGNGTFTVDVTGLIAGTGYSYAAYMINSGGTAYSSATAFTTVAVIVTSPSSGQRSETFQYTGGLQELTVPAGVTALTIEATGGAGGEGVGTAIGGLPASIQGDFSVTPGSTLTVLVGGDGQFPGGGGGGSFVWSGAGFRALAANPFGTLLVAAGGGGGGANSTNGVNAPAPAAGTGVTSSNGAAATTAGSCFGGPGGSGGSGGGAVCSGFGSNAGGGGGLTSDGGIYLNHPVSGSGNATGGIAITRGGAGGGGGDNTVTQGGAGGFGGGGGAGSPFPPANIISFGGGGGGGGYNGGAGGSSTTDNATDCGGGGGGSYNAGSNQVNLSGDAVLTDAQVTITWTLSVADPSVGNPTVTGITDTAATMGGTVGGDGGASVTEEGVVYAPTATNSTPQIGGAGVVRLAVASLSPTGAAFSVGATGLAPNTSYSFAAYATNSAGTAYSSTQVFTTLKTVANTTTAVTSDATGNASVHGQPVRFTATVGIAAPGSGTPSGSVSFYDVPATTSCTSGLPATPAATDTLNNGQAGFQTSSLSVGRHTILACYQGSTSFSASGGSLVQKVDKATTSVAVSSSSNPAALGQPVTFTANVGVTAPGAGTPTGSVTFTDGDVPLGTRPLSSGTASLTTSILTSGPQSITAAYGGDDNSKSSSDSTNVTVVAQTVTPSAAIAQYSDQVTLQATVSGLMLGTHSTGGTLQFSLNGSAVSTPVSLPASAVSGGQLIFQTTTIVTLAPGQYAISASFTPTDTANFQPASGTLPKGLTVTTEDARVTYTGATAVWTASPTSSSASVQLSATVRDISAVGSDPATDAFPGDIRTATLRFVDRAHGNATLCAPTLVLVDPADLKTATASCPYGVNLGTQTSLSLSVGLVVGGNYTRDSSADNATVQVSVARRGGSVYANGTLQTNHAAGALAPAAGGNVTANLTLQAAYTGGAARPTGNLGLMLAAGGHVYRLNGTGFTQLGESGHTAVVDATGSLFDITNLAHPLLVDGAVRIHLQLQAGSGKAAAVAFSIQRADGSLALATGWDGTQPVAVPFLTGQVNVS